MRRYATIDVGTNSVLLLVADLDQDGVFHSVLERTEITRLGRGLHESGLLDAQAVEDTLHVLRQFVDEARRLGSRGVAIAATSAARDARNGEAFLAAALERTGERVEVISGDEEAALSFAAAHADFAAIARDRSLIVVDVGGGSTEVIYGHGQGADPSAIDFRRSFDVGSVRMTERFLAHAPATAEERALLEQHLRATFAALPAAPERSVVVGLAGTVTTLYAMRHRVAPYDSARVHGGTLRAADVHALADQLLGMSVEQRLALPGLQAKRADVIAAGALLVALLMDRLGARELRVSDRGLRWGLLYQRFGPRLGDGAAAGL